MIRHRGAATRRRGDQPHQMPSSAVAIGQLLQLARQQRGIDLLTVHDRLGRPITQLESLESGNLVALHDQASALATLRRYASFLGLDGDTMALQMIEAWSATPDRRRRGQRDPDHPAVTGVVTAVSVAPEHLRAFTQTGQVSLVPGVHNAAQGGSGGYGYGTGIGPPTGMLAVVPREEIKQTKRAQRRARRRRRAPWTLRLLTWLAALLVVVGAVGLGIEHWRPNLLIKWHLVHLTQPDGAPLPAASQAVSSSTVPARTPASGGISGSHSAGAVVMQSNTQTAATYAVRSSQFAVVVGTSGPCWVQVSSPASIVPIVEGIQQAGQVKTYPASGSLTVQVGSSAVVLAVIVNGTSRLVVHPDAVPFTYTFVTVGS